MEEDLLLDDLFNEDTESVISDLEQEHIDNVNIWFAASGDYTHRIYYPELNENSRVIDVGGYVGDWANVIHFWWKCTVDVYEPFTEFSEHIQNRFFDNDKINVYPYGLLDTQLETQMQNAGDATKRSEEGQYTRFESIDTVFTDPRPVDLMKINIEGDEFPVINRMIETGDISKVKNLQVQVHWFAENVEQRYEELVAKLALTHELTYHYQWVWENWKLKE